MTRCGFLILLGWIGLILGFQTADARADFEIRSRDFHNIRVLISGTITGSDADALDKISGDLERNDFEVSLNSTGGNLFAAMRIGRVIRKYEGITRTESGARCYSSCALIFIAGVRRLSKGLLGLHRPYLASAPQSRETVEMQVPLMLSSIKQYIVEMGAKDNFYQRMVNTEPSRMLIVGSDTYTNLIPEADPVYQEIQTSYDARHYGVTTAEMRQRERDAQRCLDRKDPDVLAHYSCARAAQWGLSGRVWEARYERAQQCWRDDDDLKALWSLPKRERKDNPHWIKREICERDTMLHP